FHRGNLADAEWAMAGHVHRAVDLGGVAFGAALSRRAFHVIDDHLLPRADLALQPPLRNGLLALHEAMPALLLHGIPDRCRKIVTHSAGNGLVAEAADAIELGFLEPIEQEREILLGLTREADDEGRADGQRRAGFAPAPDAVERLLLGGGAAHAFEHVRARVL